MSFRKRNELVGAPRTLGRPTPLRPNIASSIPDRTSAVSRSSPTALPKAKTPEVPNLGVIPSPVTSQPTVSTGCSDLDKILHHLGLPLGNILLIEESGTTDFTSVLLRSFAAQGVMHSRADRHSPCHVVVVGPPAAWAKELPGEYKGTSKEQKKARIAEESNKVSVANMAENDLKIAWRYGIKNNAAESESAVNENYSTQFDITQRLVPGPSSAEMSFVPLSPSYATVVAQVSRIVDQYLRQGKVVRVVMPGFLNPLLYSPQCSSPGYIFPLFHLMRALVARTPQAVLAASLPLDLYPRTGVISQVLESIADAVIQLQPFNMEMAAMVERAYKDQPAKIQQGLVHVIKVPVLSQRGMMMVRHGEYAFKNGRKKFEIEEWGIPVEDGEEEEKQTTKNIDF